MGDARAMTAVAAAPAPLEQRLRERANGMGFDPVGIARLGPVKTYEAFAEWLRRGYAGEMTSGRGGA